MNDTPEQALVETVAEPAAAQEMATTQDQSNSVLAMISRAATDPNVDIDKMERLMEMQMKLVERQAEVDFARAMSAAQGEMPAVLKTQKNQQTKSNYESGEDVIRAITPVYTRHGFSLSYGTEPSTQDNHILIVCDVSHIGGHSKRYNYDLPYDLAGIAGKVNKTAIHASGSTITYGRRYLAKLIFNLATTDDDGQAAGAAAQEQPAALSANTLGQIQQGMDITGKSLEECLKYVKTFSGNEYELLSQLTEKEGQRLLYKLSNSADGEQE